MIKNNFTMFDKQMYIKSYKENKHSNVVNFFGKYKSFKFNFMYNRNKDLYIGKLNEYSTIFKDLNKNKLLYKFKCYIDKIKENKCNNIDN